MKLHSMARRLLPKRARDHANTSISKALGRIGFISRHAAGPIDFRGLDIEPCEALKRANGIVCLINIAPEHLRNVGPVTGASYFPCAENQGNPFVETIAQYLTDSALSYERSPLKLYHNSFRPDNIANALGLDGDGPMHFLLKQPPLLTFPPWAPPPLNNYTAHLRQRRHNINVENKSAGIKLSHAYGHYGFGPVKDEKGMLEITRLKRVTDSITKKRLQNNSGTRGRSGYWTSVRSRV